MWIPGSCLVLNCIDSLSLSAFLLQCHIGNLPGHVAQLVTCLAAGTCLNADPWVASFILAGSHTLVVIDHEIFLTDILLPSADSRSRFVCYKGKYVHELLVNCLVELAQEKKCGLEN